MVDKSQYVLPKVWQQDDSLKGKWAAINRPVSGATHTKELPVGKKPIQLYSLNTPNGIKVNIMLEELLELGIDEASYDFHKISISDGKQFSSGFVDINPNSKIPALVDQSSENEVILFESGAILLYLAEKFNKLIPEAISDRAKCLSWLFWQVGSGPYLGGGFGHFYKYAPEKIKYCIDRFTMEAKRQLDLLDKQLDGNQYICGDQYTIADIAIFPWYGGVVLNKVYEAAEFLDVKSYKNLNRWAEQISQRPAVKRGL
ncbi:glutathione-dependent disulfide-bond oxidoreductase [Francisella sp. 19X1-34]|uniref:glutathione-dependent disulfide-bond oxidoreductase n=1 Tax=Francisella sp. 19X1-34 TaxID=3087177 RepID=UPI002E3268AD|nr:glutathione-dependent disulfide-bond oxidoreductase [Francisella sp. 19X1-34]MED7789228.1 glutathione-dependent disulfide-bond oxidoreductase [Francisella sp. 19X1-34]